MKTFKEYVNEATKEVISIDGQDYTFSIIKTSKDTKYESPYFSIMLKPIKNRDAKILVYKDIFHYTKGYDQNSNSGEQNYLYTKGWGGAGNGGGEPGTPVPTLYGREKSAVFNNILEGEYDDDLFEFEYGTKIADIKKRL